LKLKNVPERDMKDERKREVMDLCSKMIQISSITGEEKALVKFLEGEMKTLGFDTVRVDERGSIIGKIKGRGSGKTILFDGHLDTVPVSSQSFWTKDPFSADIENGKMYGRGTSDMKGALASMIMAASFLKRDGGTDGDVYVSGTVFEEVAEGWALDFILDAIQPDIVIIGESTELNLNIGQRGRAEIIIKTKGIPAHSSNPEAGVNAVYKMVSLIEKINGISVPVSPTLGEGTIVLTDIISTPYPGASVIPEICSATFDRRLLTGETKDSVLKPIKEVILELSKSDTTFNAEVSIAEAELETYTGYKAKHYKFAPAWILDADNAAIEKALTALRETGLNLVEIGIYSFCTNGSSSAGIHNITTLGFGPGREDHAHINDEYVEIEELIMACEGYYALAVELTV